MEKAVAVGEIGLDYYWDKENHEKQEYWFRRQIALAREEKLPMIIHSREAAADTLRVMKEEKSEEIGGVIHCKGIYEKRYVRRNHSLFFLQ